MSDDISFQTWICPACCDDHSPSSGCYKEIAKKDARIKELEGLVEKAILKKDFSNYSSFLDSLKQNGFSFFIAIDMGDSIKYQIYNDIESKEEEIKSNYDLLCACENIAKAYGERIKELGINNE